MVERIRYAETTQNMSLLDADRCFGMGHRIIVHKTTWAAQQEWEWTEKLVFSLRLSMTSEVRILVYP
jgi:hypothetical protein